MKTLISFALIVFAAAKANAFVAEGVYGSFTYYCGFELTHDLRSGTDIILTYVDNPAYEGRVLCNVRGISELYRYDSTQLYYYEDTPTLLCIIQHRGSRELIQTCYSKKDGVVEDVHSSVRYYRYR